ncbi:MAG: AI-2E family transporter [Taibaiella sp.]|jgi:predicted PurR-regulated permease PerM
MKYLPLTVRRSIELLGLCALGLIIVLGQNVIMPLLMAFFIAMLLLPMFRWFRKYKVPEVIAIVLCIILFFLVIAVIAFFLSWQIGGFVSDIDTIQKNLSVHWNNLSTWINSKTNYTADQQLEMIRNQGSKLGSNVAGYLQGAVVSLSGILIFLGLLPIYIFLILFYRNLLIRFVYLWFGDHDHTKVEGAIKEAEGIVKYYLFGLMIQIGYLTVLLGGILMLFGIKHALLIGITFAILNLIPYLGALIGNLIGILLTLTTSQELWQIWAVLGTIAVVQFLDNNILMPKIVGSKVKVNALASIVGIVIGGTVAGISGMFLSIPVMAVLKIIFDKTDHLRQWGILLGDARPGLNPISNRMFRINKKIESKKEQDPPAAEEQQ